MDFNDLVIQDIINGNAHTQITPINAGNPTASQPQTIKPPFHQTSKRSAVFPPNFEKIVDEFDKTLVNSGKFSTNQVAAVIKSFINIFSSRQLFDQRNPFPHECDRILETRWDDPCNNFEYEVIVEYNGSIMPFFKNKIVVSIPNFIKISPREIIEDQFFSVDIDNFYH